MLNKPEILATTTNSSIYNKVNKEINAYCSRCRWHRGCNRRHSKRSDNRCWKRYRKHQYKLPE